MYKGIDYGFGLHNCDHKTGIRYGVIHSNDVGEAWYDQSEILYPEYTPEQMTCPTCEGSGEVFGEDEADSDVDECPDCCGTGEIDDPDDRGSDMIESCGSSYDRRGYEATCGERGDIFVMKSPYFTRAQFCSPCAPGACYLTNLCDDGERAYCFGHEWYEGGKAPYPVFSVESGELVEPTD